MPTYEYQCSNCGHELEEFQSINEAPLTLCPACKGETLLRIMGGGAGLIFRGSGFYLTDYKKSTPPSDAPKGKSTGSDGGSTSPPPEKK
jgi:putative FmdB family regulatory protein